MPYSNFNLSDLQDYVPHNPCDDNRDLVALSGASYAAGDSNPVEAINASLPDPTFQFCADVLRSISRLFPGLPAYHEIKDERGAPIDKIDVQALSKNGESSRHQDNHQPIPGEIEDSHHRHTVYATSLAYNSKQYEGLSTPAVVPVHMSSFPVLMNCRDTTSLGSRHEPSASPSIPSMGQPGLSNWHQGQFDEPFQPSIDRSVWPEHDMAAPSALHLDSERAGFLTHPTVPDAFDGTLSHRDNGKNLMVDQHTAPVENVDGNEMSSSLSPHIGGRADAAQHQVIFSDNAWSWVELGEGPNTHYPTTSFSLLREEKENCTSTSIRDGHEEHRSRLTNEPVERQYVDKAQKNDGGYGGRREIGPSQTIGSGESGSRKRQHEESDSEIESAGGSHKPKKSKVKESLDSVPGDRSTGVQGARGKRRNLNPRAPAMMKSYAHDLTPLATSEAKQGGFIPFVAAETKAASKAFAHHQMSVNMENMTIV
ncbi:hypothetical protein JR316_0008602 [Psilocybe cubensis]|nr:hypothetical protein JR316_0008602 [Psilocybe cubensis]KAH9478149.1 hypothetical protein JR316_0008602 [Psilocybe cubensis]